MKQVTDNKENINADINALVDRLHNEKRFLATHEVIELIRASNSYEVKDVLIELEYNTNNQFAQTPRGYLNTFDRLLELVFDDLIEVIEDNPDPFDVPLTDEEMEQMCYENAMLEQSKRDRREYESTLLSFSEEGRTVGSINNTEGDLR